MSISKDEYEKRMSELTTRLTDHLTNLGEQMEQAVRNFEVAAKGLAEAWHGMAFGKAFDIKVEINVSDDGEDCCDGL